MLCLGHSTPIEPGLLTHFLENDRVPVRVFYAEELKPVWCHFRTLSLQTSVREFQICKLYIGATDVKHGILGPLRWSGMGRSFESYRVFSMISAPPNRSHIQ